MTDTRTEFDMSTVRTEFDMYRLRECALVIAHTRKPSVKSEGLRVRYAKIFTSNYVTLKDMMNLAISLDGIDSFDCEKQIGMRVYASCSIRLELYLSSMITREIFVHGALESAITLGNKYVRFGFVQEVWKEIPKVSRTKKAQEREDDEEND
jgi:hypothetical protein